MSLIIRPYTPEDYPVIAQIINAARPHWQTTADDLRYADETRDPKCKFGLWIAEDAGEPLGVTLHTQYSDLYAPHEFWVNTYVLPDYQRRGVGRALFTHLLAAMQGLQPQRLKVSLREDQRSGLAFAGSEGFTETSRRWEAILDVSTCDLSPYAETEAHLGEVMLKSYADLADDPDRDRKLHVLQTMLDADVPIDELVTPMAFEQYQKTFLQHPNFVPEGSFIAVEGEQYIGMSTFMRTSDTGLDIELTGVLREYRRRGIALALKVRGIRFAQVAGYREIRVMNDPTNTGMMAINQQLGFLRDMTYIKLVREY